VTEYVCELFVEEFSSEKFIDDDCGGPAEGLG
jgi:hypothetical protein